jgi:DNA polymerase I-like protein with 3'-5' exonuclease and polymerase domains
MEYTEKEQSGVYKTGAKAGEPKYRNVTRTLSLIQKASVLKEWETKTKGIYKVDEDVLKEVRNSVVDTQLRDFIDTLLKYREVKKELSTYITGLKEVIYEDGYIHGNLHHTSTHTGRLSSSNPNLQNFTN